MTYEAFRAYVADVLARLVKTCINAHMTSSRALGVMRWAQGERETIWDSFEAGEATQDVATELYRLSGQGAA